MARSASSRQVISGKAGKPSGWPRRGGEGVSREGSTCRASWRTMRCGKVAFSCPPRQGGGVHNLFVTNFDTWQNPS